MIIYSCNTVRISTDDAMSKGSSIPHIQVYEPTEEAYALTFESVNTIVRELNSVIQAKDFDKWLSYLTSEYIKEKSDPSVLEELSDQPTMRANRITLQTLEDYFFFVIVPSRTNSVLERIVFINENCVKALSTLYGKPVILYNLVKVDGVWKIGIAK